MVAFGALDRGEHDGIGDGLKPTRLALSSPVKLPTRTSSPTVGKRGAHAAVAWNPGDRYRSVPFCAGFLSHARGLLGPMYGRAMN